MEEIINIDGFEYKTSLSTIKEGDFFIQMDGGDQKPILRKKVSEEWMDANIGHGINNSLNTYSNIHAFFEKHGYFPYSWVAHPENGRFAISWTNNPATGIEAAPSDSEGTADSPAVAQINHP